MPIDTGPMGGYTIVQEVMDLLLGHETILPGQSGHDAGRVLLARLFFEKTGRPLPAIAIAERGKPYFRGEALHFSISHTKRHVFCALADRPIGIDAEELDRNIDLRLADKILSADERAQFDRAANQRLALLTFWVLKEAQAKLTGTGLQCYPNHTNFSLTDPRVQIRQGCLVAIIKEDDHAV